MMRQHDGSTGAAAAGGGGGGGAGSTSSALKEGDLSSASAVTPTSQNGNNHSTHRVSASLGELTPPGSAGIQSTSNDEANSNLVFSDLY